MRLSFALSDWHSLGLLYKPALGQLQNFRNDAEKNVKEEINPYQFFHDFEAINEELGENERTILLFKWLDLNKPTIAQQVFKIAKPYLLKANEKAIFEKYSRHEPNPISTVRPSNELPMYGGEDKSHIEPNKDFSQGASRLGWQYLSKGDYDTAIKRFNQAWMFDHNNVEALWGFGLIMGQRATQEEPLKNLNESVRYLTMATSLEQNNERLIVDLAYSHTLLGALLKDQDKNPERDFFKAEELIKQAKAIQPNFPIIYSNWSVLEFYKGNYPKAKDLLEQSKKLGFEPNPSFVQELNAKL